jgi:hypothetical protein
MTIHLILILMRLFHAVYLYLAEVFKIKVDNRLLLVIYSADNLNRKIGVMPGARLATSSSTSREIRKGLSINHKEIGVQKYTKKCP